MRTEADIADCGTGGGGGGTGNLSGQAFQYTATGSEGDAFTVNLPTAQADTSYDVFISGGGLAAFLLFDAPKTQYTVNSIQVKCSAAPTAGDVLNILVVER